MSATSPSKYASGNEIQALIDAQVTALEPEDQRRALILRDDYGLSRDEIADELGKATPEATRELHRRGRPKLIESVRKRLDA